MSNLPFHTNCASAFVLIVTLIASQRAVAVEPASESSRPGTPAVAADRQAALDAKLSKMLSGATLDGSFTVSDANADTSKLSREKYTLGDVKKVGGDVWLFPTRIEYGGKDVTLPIPLPVRWAGDTPVVVVDEVALPGFGTVSARVMFFDGHYAGYWKHGTHSGNLFGEIRSKVDDPPAAKSPADKN